MPVRFWLGVLDVGPRDAGDSPGNPIAAARPGRIAIEVIRAGREFAVLFSEWREQPGGGPRTAASLRCLLGFANGARSSIDWLDRGFPLVDACITFRRSTGTLAVRAPCFGAREAMEYDPVLVEIEGIRFGARRPDGVALDTTYHQAQQAPDEARPATHVRRLPVRWTPLRARVLPVPGTIRVTLKDPPARYFGLAPLEPGPSTLRSAWTGELMVPGRPEPAPASRRARRDDALGLPAFRFEDVEVLGFRVELDGPEVGGDLEELISPLNFHLAGSRAPRGGRLVQCRTRAGPVPDFAYRAATRTVLVEVLRYGKMKVLDPRPPVGQFDYQSQHELLVRVLVGRVDDDTAQARSPAVYVPAIFVDNPWSKVLGRDVVGYEKQLARFCTVRDGRILALTPDGFLPQGRGTGPVPLVDVSRVSLATRAGSDRGPALVEIERSAAAASAPFERVDVQVALSSSAFSVTRWRQGDFELAEFRRSFARTAAAATLRAFRSIQVCPVGERDLQRSWISGTFEVDDVRVARPSGVASLTVHAPPEATKGWLRFCKLLGVARGRRRTLSFPSGSWYRLKSSMDLTIEGLE